LVVVVVESSVDAVPAVVAESPVVPVPVVDIVSDDVGGVVDIVESGVPVVVPVPEVPAVPPGIVWPPVVPVPPVPVVVPVCAKAAVDRPSAATANIMLFRIVSLQYRLMGFRLAR
jgi:hypothetical protein